MDMATDLIQYNAVHVAMTYRFSGVGTNRMERRDAAWGRQMATVTTFRTEKCCPLVSTHEMSARRMRRGNSS